MPIAHTGATAPGSPRDTPNGDISLTKDQHTTTDTDNTPPTTPGDSVAPAQPESPPITGHLFDKHVFVCTDGESCAGVDGDAWGIHGKLKKAVARDPSLKGRIRINKSGCLDQCGFGPMIVIYPDNVWYWAVEPDDVDEIVREHLIGGRPVERLIYRNKPGKNKLLRDEQMRPIGRPPRPCAVPAASPATTSSSESPQRKGHAAE
jgi:(2Fe-2S) ferredoxin